MQGPKASLIRREQVPSNHQQMQTLTTQCLRQPFEAGFALSKPDTFWHVLPCGGCNKEYCNTNLRDRCLPQLDQTPFAADGYAKQALSPHRFRLVQRDTAVAEAVSCLYVRSICFMRPASRYISVYREGSQDSAGSSPSDQCERKESRR